MRNTRVIPVVLLDGNRAIKTKLFKESDYLGDPVNIIRLFSEKLCDELIILDITATKEKRNPDKNFLKNLSSQAFMPLAFGGNIQSLEDAKKVFDSGMEKVVLGSSAILNPEVIAVIAKYYGSQAISICLDVISLKDEMLLVKTTQLAAPQKISLPEFIDRMHFFGAGEIILQSVSRDSTSEGYDLELIEKVSSLTKIPIVALGGCSGLLDMLKAKEAGASALAAGTFFTLVGEQRAVLVNYPSERQLEIFDEKYTKRLTNDSMPIHESF